MAPAYGIVECQEPQDCNKRAGDWRDVASSRRHPGDLRRPVYLIKNKFPGNIGISPTSLLPFSALRSSIMQQGARVEWVNTRKVIWPVLLQKTFTSCHIYYPGVGSCSHILTLIACLKCNVCKWSKKWLSAPCFCRRNKVIFWRFVIHKTKTRMRKTKKTKKNKQEPHTEAKIFFCVYSLFLLDLYQLSNTFLLGLD